MRATRPALLAAGLFLVALVGASPTGAAPSTVANSGWKTSSDSDLAGLTMRVWMSAVAGPTPCTYTVIVDFDWTKAPKRWISGSAQTPDFIGITVSSTSGFVRLANSQESIAHYYAPVSSTTTTVNLPIEDLAGNGAVWDVREWGASKWMTDGQVRMTIRGPQPCSNFTMTVNAEYNSNDGIDGGPFTVGWGAAGFGLGFNVLGTSSTGKLYAEFSYTR